MLLFVTAAIVAETCVPWLQRSSAVAIVVKFASRTTLLVPSES